MPVSALGEGPEGGPLMARGRMLNGKVADSLRVNRLPGNGALLFCYIISKLDCQGAFWGSGRMVKAKAFALWPEGERKVESYLVAMETSPLKDGYPLIKRYWDDGEQYLCMPGFFGEQPGLRVERETPQFPPPPPGLMPARIPQNAGKMPARIPRESAALQPEVAVEGEGEGEGERGGADAPLPTVSKEDKEIIQIWIGVKNFKATFIRCCEALVKLKAAHPGLDLKDKSEGWAVYKLDHPLLANSSPLSQIRNWMANAEKFKAQDAQGQRQGPGKRPGTDYAEEGRRYAERIKGRQQ